MSSEVSGKLGDDPTLLLFAVELALNRGNASAAARAVGWSESKGHRLVADRPELRRLVKRAMGTVAADVVEGWKQMHAKARSRIRELMDSPDAAVSLRRPST